jgi:hypothetical protein
MEALREEVIEAIEIARAELRPIAQPHEIAQLGELLLDAREATDEDQLRKISDQLRSLREFSESRHKSEGMLKAARPSKP